MKGLEEGIGKEKRGRRERGRVERSERRGDGCCCQEEGAVGVVVRWWAGRDDEAGIKICRFGLRIDGCKPSQAGVS